MDKILVVVPVINLWDEYTIHCMESLYAQQCETPFEILILDNGSTDQTVEKAHDFAGRKMPGRVHVVSNGANKGVAASWNQGVQWGMDHGCTHIVIANNDIRCGPHMLQGMIARFHKGGVDLVSAVDVIREVLIPDMVTDPAHAVNNKVEGESPHPNFSCFMITPATVEKVGWFDEIFYPGYFEDNSYHYRIKLVGGLAVANTKCIFIHYGSRTQNQATTKPIVHGENFRKNEAEYIRMWGGPPGHEQYVNPYNNKNASPVVSKDQKHVIVMDTYKQMNYAKRS